MGKAASDVHLAHRIHLVMTDLLLHLVRRTVAMRIRRRGLSRLATLVLVISGLASAAFATDLPGVLPAALDQPRINAVLRRTPTGNPLTADIGGEQVYNIAAFFDTGASGVLVSHQTYEALGVQKLRHPEPNGPLVEFEDVGVAGSDIFNVSEPLYVSLSPFFEPFESPPLTNYTQTFGPLRAQISPPNPNPLLEGLDVFGMPTMAGKVVVMDPKPADPFNPNLGTMHTFVYDPGTPFNPAAADTNPGIPQVDRHVDLSYGTFERFTQITPPGAPGPTLRHNPFIGPNPVLQLEPNPPPDTTPGVSITFGGQASTGSWLLDTGAAASIISLEQAANLNVRYRPGTEGTSSPRLETFNPLNPAAPGVLIDDQFTLAIGGVGGVTSKAGFFLDSLLVRTLEGNAANDNDPNHLRYLGAPVLVSDIALEDPDTQQSLTLDGIFGMNMLVGTAWFDPVTFQFLGLADGHFNWVTFDEPNGTLGLDLKDVISLPPNEWIRASSGNWGDANNWSHGLAPDSNTVSVLLGPAIVANANVDLQSTNRTVRTLRFNHQSRSYNVTSNGGTLVFESSAGPAAIQFDAANNVSHEIAAPVRFKSDTEFYGLFEDLRLTLSGGQTWDPGRTLTVRSGTLRYNLDNADLVIVDSGNSLVINDGGAVQLAGEKSPLSGTGSVLDVISHVNVINNSGRGLTVVSGNHEMGALSGTGNSAVAGGSSLTAGAIRQSALTLSEAGSRVIIRNNGTGAGVSVLNSLAIAGATDGWTARFDPNNNDAIFKSTAAAKTTDFNRLYNQLRQGFNAGNWMGNGIGSTSAATNAARDTTLALVDNAVLGNTSFSGQPVTADSILLKYTYYGDIDLNGVVDADDLTVFANNFGRVSGATQIDGDIDFNGSVNADDLTVFANNFGKGAGAPLAVANVQAVPEPGTLILAALAGALFVIRSCARQRFHR